MIKFTIGENEAGQRLDRFLKKYLKTAPLSYIYKMVRKDVKVGGKRVKEDYLLQTGDELCLYLSEEEAAKFTRRPREPMAKKQFRIAYEDEAVLAVSKPFGLLTHGTAEEHKNTLANQVIAYLVESGGYRPGREKTFVPSPANRLDRNTTGLVLFAKTYPALKALTAMVREEGYLSKYYLAIVKGSLQGTLELVDRIEKNEETNTSRVLPAGCGEGKEIRTTARPLAVSGGYSLVEVELHTGRSHQIRVHLAKAGYPIIGDEKYGKESVNRRFKKEFGLPAQFLHAYRIQFHKGCAPLEHLTGTSLRAELPPDRMLLLQALFPDAEI